MSLIFIFVLLKSIVSLIKNHSSIYIKFMFIKDFKKKCVAVIGDLMLDRYKFGSCSRISPEAPVQIVDIDANENLLGGAGNVAANLKKLNQDIILYSVLGKDATGNEIIKILKDLSIENSNILRDKSRLTSEKNRLIARNQQIVRFDNETTNPITEELSNKIFQLFIKDLKSNKIDAVIISDYGKGVLSDLLIQNIIKEAKNKSIPILCDPKGNDFKKYMGSTTITPNKKEASIASGINIVDKNSLHKAGKKLIKICNLQFLIITLSEDGIALFNDDKMTILSTNAKDIFDVSGAGDTVISAITFGLLNNFNLIKSCKFANLAAEIVISKFGTSTASIEEINSLTLNTKKNKIVDLNDLLKILEYKKLENKKIVFTNGCFDILHSGHVSFLEKASFLGDILIVGLNSDNSIRSLKGNKRPINIERDRAKVLSGLEVVNFIITFEEDTPIKLIEKISPDVLVKGEDYLDKNIIGADIVEGKGGEVKLVEFLEGRSTTAIINKIKNIYL